MENSILYIIISFIFVSTIMISIQLSNIAKAIKDIAIFVEGEVQEASEDNNTQQGDK